MWFPLIVCFLASVCVGYRSASLEETSCPPQMCEDRNDFVQSRAYAKRHVLFPRVGRQSRQSIHWPRPDTAYSEYGL
ncbi:hypothetical protein CRM22_010293 [Opisthorchis felineus]|uniref:Secreted protein n=1 Tax=Opisthorchis felineus TaxID=147828 RepID=A0A4S2L163_OPIFE|nr:hypothetical protein CRM22_010293 [Opisthorchis felineus]